MREIITKVWYIFTLQHFDLYITEQLKFFIVLQNMKYGNMPAGSKTEKKGTLAC